MPEVKERGCGRRQKGACYLTVPVAEKGQGTPLDTFLLCPPRPVDAEALRLSPMGVRLHELGGITHVFDWVGASHYKNVADVIAESRRSGVSRRISRMSDFSRLGPGSCLLLLHERALIENAADYWSELRNEARELLPPHADIWQPRHRCPKKLWEHVNIPMEPPMPAEMCQALYWEDVEGGDVVLDPAVPWRSVDRTVGSTTYRARRRPDGIEPVYRLAAFAMLPIHHLTVINDPEGGRHEAALDAARESGLSVELEDE